MQRGWSIPAGLGVAMLVAGALSACGGRPSWDGTSGVEESASPGHVVSVSADTLAGPSTAAELSDANIFALLDHAAHADSSAGAIAAIKGTDARVRRFARLMMADHHGLRTQSSDLARRLGVIPQPFPDDPVIPLAQQQMDALESTPKGIDFDRTYLRREIVAHQTVLDLAEQAHRDAGSLELKALIERARPLLERHLEQAQALEQELGATA
jgi:putative membrane protein